VSTITVSDQTRLRVSQKTTRLYTRSVTEMGRGRGGRRVEVYQWKSHANRGTVERQKGGGIGWEEKVCVAHFIG